MRFSNPENEWFEIWYSEGVEYIPAFLLIVTPNPENQNEIIVLDIAKNEIHYKNQNYEDICSWLWEDEFDRVGERVFPNSD